MSGDLDAEIRAAQAARRAAAGVPLGAAAASFDPELYDDSNSLARIRAGGAAAGYVTELPDDEDDNASAAAPRTLSATSIAARMKAEMHEEVSSASASHAGADAALLEEHRARFGSGVTNSRISARESDYHARRLNRGLSPDRGEQSYADAVAQTRLDAEKAALTKRLAQAGETGAESAPVSSGSEAGAAPGRKRRRWDDTESTTSTRLSDATGAELHDGSSVHTRWDATPVAAAAGGPRHVDDDALSAVTRESWDATPVTAREASWEAGATPAVTAGTATGAGARKRSRWDETPVAAASGGATPAYTSSAGATPLMHAGATPTPSALAGAATPVYLGGSTPIGLARARVDAEMDARNRPLSDEELEGMFPKGYKVLEPPAGYVPIRTPSRKLTGAPQGAGATPGFTMLDTPSRDAYAIPATAEELSAKAGGDLPFMKPEDVQYFGALLEERDEADMDEEEKKSRTIMALLLKIKNGTPPQRKSALKQITLQARALGAGPLFNQILPLLLSTSLEDQERHLLVKVIDRVMFRLDDLVRPYVHKILVVIEPMLIDEDYYARVEGREIISNLAKAAGLATMIATMRPDLDHVDEYVRNTTARAFAVVASALGIPALLPFLKAVCASKKSWQARHTGLKIVQQIAILMGCAVLPHLALLVDITGPGLADDQQQVRIMSALALAGLAESAAPYGIEAFDSVLRPLWLGIRQHRGKALAAFLKAIGCVIPLMDAQYASHYTREVMTIVIREFATPDDEMKKIVLKVVRQCVSTEGVEADYIAKDILPEFFRCFWTQAMALDRRNYRALVDTTVEMANRVGASAIVTRVVKELKHPSEPYRRMVMETVDKVIAALGAADVDPRLEELLMDGMLYAFQEQTLDDSAAVLLSGFSTVSNALSGRMKPYLPQIAATIKWRLNLKSPQVRMHAADLLGKVAGAMRTCGEDALLGHLGIVLYECLGEEFPEVLGSILGGLKAIVNVIGMSAMQPPIKDLLPRLTPILKNRHEKVQENCIDLVGRIADRGQEFAAAREWMRICFELLEMLKAQKKIIRRTCVNTFGYIAKAIGPQDVMHALLNNLKVQERQLRICTTVAIAIVAETCEPFTVLPALMNEYRVPDMNVQNGVLKAMSFMFEYIGEQARDYVYAVTPLLQDALIDRDLVHRQTALFALKHLALGLQGHGCEDALQHLLNYAWPNILETSAHVMLGVFETIEGMRVSLGAPRLLQYVLQGLFHPARRVREVYWRVYNNLYVYGADALTMCYPRLEIDDPDPFGATAAAAGASAEGATAAAPKRHNVYERTYLQLMI